MRGFVPDFGRRRCSCKGEARVGGRYAAAASGLLGRYAGVYGAVERPGDGGDQGQLAELVEPPEAGRLGDRVDREPMGCDLAGKDSCTPPRGVVREARRQRRARRTIVQLLRTQRRGAGVVGLRVVALHRKEGRRGRRPGEEEEIAAKAPLRARRSGRHRAADGDGGFGGHRRGRGVGHVDVCRSGLPLPCLRSVRSNALRRRYGAPQLMRRRLLCRTGDMLGPPARAEGASRRSRRRQGRNDVGHWLAGCDSFPQRPRLASGLGRVPL
mmetsp:Transcript_65534/g.188932  ORF Transcript_65534/g.188932 Transcript_65534/m.188932 type:complete len:269 (-) Transcript_65534:2387-3193(-)